MKTRFTSLIIALILIVIKTNAQEKIDRVGDNSFVERLPVMTMRSNGNLLIASETEPAGGGDIDILVVEYDINTSAIVRQQQFGESNINEKPRDILEQADGRILILGTREGQLHVSGLANRRHGMLMQIQNSGSTAFSYMTSMEMVPGNPFVQSGTTYDYQVTPNRMKLNSAGDIVAVGQKTTFSAGPSYVSSATEAWTYEIDGSTLTVNIEDHYYPDTRPGIGPCLTLMPNGDIVTSGYAILSNGLTPVVSVFNSTMTSRTCTPINFIHPDYNELDYTGTYFNAYWNDHLLLVGDYLTGNTVGLPHQIFVAKTKVQSDRKVTVNSVQGYRHDPSTGGSIYDGNLFNDFRSMRVKDILVDGNQLLVLGIICDENEASTAPAPSFMEFCVMSIDLYTMEPTYTYVFSNMSAYKMNGAGRIIKTRGPHYAFCGNREFGTDKDIMLAQFKPNSRLECLTQLGMKRFDMSWVIEEGSYEQGTNFTEPELLTMDDPTPDISTSTPCSASDGVCQVIDDYIYYPDNSTIFVNTVWGTQQKGTKYYVDGELVVQDVTLDITNCDVVFGPCAKLVFSGANARLRANNSVFRSCDNDEKWKGIVFEGGTAHRVVNCEFKDAMTAIEIPGNSVNIEQIISNTFLNNYIAIHLVDAELSGTITGNHIEVNMPTSQDHYLNPACTPIESASLWQFYGIRAMNSVIWSPISNNEFVADDPLVSETSRPWDFFGIYFSQSVGMIEKNSFTNNTSAIYQDGNNSSQPNFLNRIDENTVSLARTAHDATAQIVVVGNQSQSINSLITKNKLACNQSLDLNRWDFTAIHVESCNNAVVEENEIKGFDVGIYLWICENPEVTQNNIKSWIVGIYSRISEGEKINCNVIDMNFRNNGANTVGIHLDICNLVSTSATLHSNCIFNTVDAVFINGFGPSPLQISNLPSIMNNFFYNYTSFGLLMLDVTGNIGSPTVDAMNTFAKNSGPAGVQDLTNISTGTVNAYGNYFQTTVTTTFNVAVFNPTIHSVASCGHQTSDPAAQISGTISNEFKCNPSGLNFLNPNGGQGGGGSELISTGIDGSEFMNAKSFFGYTGANAYGYDKKAVYLDMLNAKLSGKQIDSNTFNLCMSQYAQAGLDYPSAIRYLLKVKVKTQILEERKAIEIKRLQILGGLIGDAEKQTIAAEMKGIIATENENFNPAYHVLSLITGETGFRLPERKDIQIDPNGSQLAVTDNIHFNLSPNPASDQLNLEIATTVEFMSDSELKISITDMTGKVLLTSEYNLISGVVKLNVENLTPGIYFINVLCNDTTSKTLKFIKS